jgi:hypothetical protein
MKDVDRFNMVLSNVEGRLKYHELIAKETDKWGEPVDAWGNK